MKKLKESLEKIFFEYFVRKKWGLWRQYLPEPKPDDIVGEKLFGITNLMTCLLLCLFFLAVIVFIFLSMLGIKNDQFVGIVKMFIIIYVCCGILTGLIMTVYEFRYNKSWLDITFFILRIIVTSFIGVYLLLSCTKSGNRFEPFKITFVLLIITVILGFIYLKIHKRI